MRKSPIVRESRTSSWAWNSLHRMVSYTNGNAAQVQWQYNLRNLSTTITYPGSLNVTRGYSETFPAASGVVDTFAFNAADQVTAVASMKGGNCVPPWGQRGRREERSPMPHCSRVLSMCPPDKRDCSR